MIKIAYKTDLGISYFGRIEHALKSKKFEKYKGKVNLIFTSPPFPLNRKKKYGNLQDEEYLEWFSCLGTLFKEYLAENGSIVIELGNSWEPGKPTMSTLAIRALLEFVERNEYHLCQQFVWFNTAKLPSPAQWVTIERIRVKDSFTNIWWMSKSERPKADNKKVLDAYSDRMEKLLNSKKYNSGKRPSEHVISDKSFLSNNGGSIPSNVLVSSNTQSNTKYLKYCKSKELLPHPARMPEDIPDFFIKFLTDPGDIVLDPFGGSNTTGKTAEMLDRKWLSVEADEDYIKGSIGRFELKKIKEKMKLTIP